MMVVPQMQKAAAEHVVRLHNEELEHGARITEIWLQRRGVENDPHAKAVVMLRTKGGTWVKGLEEPLDGNFSHCLHVRAATLKG